MSPLDVLVWAGVLLVVVLVLALAAAIVFAVVDSARGVKPRANRPGSKEPEGDL